MKIYFKSGQAKLVASFFVVLLIVTLASCTKKIEEVGGKTLLAKTDKGQYLENLLAYKKSPHQLLMGYYSAWEDAAIDGDIKKPKMTDLPDSVDIVSVFQRGGENESYFKTLKETYIPALQAKGTKVIWTQGYWPWRNVKDSSDQAGIDAAVKDIMNTINEYNYDGFDIDFERKSREETGIIVKIYEGLSKYLGPKSGTGKLLILDTDEDAENNSTVATLLEKIKDKIDYVFFQAYRRSASQVTSSFSNGFSKYIPASKFLVGVNFQGQDGTESSNIALINDFAKWQPKKGVKGGVLIYGIDEIVNNKNFNTATRASIQEMNPAK